MGLFTLDTDGIWRINFFRGQNMKCVRGFLGVAVVLWVVWVMTQVVRGEEGAYQGRTFSQWQGDLRDPSPEIRKQVAWELGKFGFKAVPALVRILRDNDASEQLKLEAARTLGEIGPAAKEAVPALIEA